MERLAEEAVEQRAGGADLERVPHLAEDLALARHERVEPGGDAEQVQRGAVVAEPVEHGGERRAVVACEREQRRRSRARPGASLVVVAREVELGAVAGREHDRLAARRASSPASAAAPSASTATRSRSSTGAWRCETPTRRESHDAKWVSGRTTATSAKPDDEQPARSGGRGDPISRRRIETGRVQRPDRERDRHRHVEVAALEAARARRRCRPTGRRARRRRCGPRGGRATRAAAAQPQQAGVALLQPPLLPEVEAGEPGRERQPGEARRASGRRGGRAASRPCRRVDTPVPPPAQAATSSAAGERHHREAEQPVARRAAPDQVGADDEPDEQVQRARPRAPREAVAVERLRDRAAPSGRASRCARPRCRAAPRRPVPRNAPA